MDIKENLIINHHHSALNTCAPTTLSKTALQSNKLPSLLTSGSGPPPFKVMDNLPDTILQTNSTGIIEYCSPSHENILGYDPDYLVGRSIFDFVHPQDLNHIMAVFNFGLLSQSLIRLAFYFKHADNHYLYVEITGKSLHDNQVKVSGAVFCIREISHRIVTENMLRFSSEKFSKAFFCNPGPTSITTFHQGRFMEVNKAFLDFSGYEYNEIIGHTSYELDLWVAPDHRDILLKQLQEQGSVCSVELPLRAKSGKILTVLFSIEIIDMLGDAYLLSIIQDITERKQAENSLYQSENKFHKAFHCNPDPLSITTLAEGCLVEVNEAFLKTTGCRREEVLGRTASDLNIWLIPGQGKRIQKRLVKQGSLHGIEVKIRSRSGVIRTVLMSLEIIEMEGNPHILSIAKDITDRIRMEEALRVSEECFAKAFHASPITMCITTLDLGRMINVNSSFCHLIGHSRKEMLGHTTLELGIWSDPAERKFFIRLIRRDGRVRNLEASLVTKSGQVLEGLVSAERLVVDGQSCILATFTDMTEKRQMEKEINRLDRLNLVGQMAASIGHEIRNPMTTVRGFLQVLKFKDKFQDESDTFNLMIEELDRANSIISEFLSLARNKLIKPEQSDLNAIISNLFPLIEANATAQDKSAGLNLADLPVLLLDQKEIRQLILNLVQNGLEAMQPGGILTIKTYFDGLKAVLSIHDQGHGMDPDVQKNIGTPFFTTKDDGTGLGIPICYGIANRHNAAIEILSSPSGTEFRISFPLPTNTPGSSLTRYHSVS